MTCEHATVAAAEMLWVLDRAPSCAERQRLAARMVEISHVGGRVFSDGDLAPVSTMSRSE